MKETRVYLTNQSHEWGEKKGRVFCVELKEDGKKTMYVSLLICDIVVCDEKFTPLVIKENEGPATQKTGNIADTLESDYKNYLYDKAVKCWYVVNKWKILQRDTWVNVPNSVMNGSSIIK